MNKQEGKNKWIKVGKNKIKLSQMQITNCF